MTDYRAFLDSKAQYGASSGFAPLWLPDFLFDFQMSLVDWAVRKGRCAIFADCGLGKTPMQLVWAENVVRKTNKPVLILTPLAVSYQTVAEAEKFGIQAHKSTGEVRPGINVINYERLHKFRPSDFSGVVCDESGILKNFDGARRAEITEFMRTVPYRLLCTATAAPNDYIELGTSSEALGYLGYTDMLGRFFMNAQNTIKPMVYRNKGQNVRTLDDQAKWRFKGHAEIPFWRWVCSWARAIRKPSDFGFDDGRFVLPDLIERQHVVVANTLAPGKLFATPALGLDEQREELRRTITERCEKAAELVDAVEGQSLVWCDLNKEGDRLESIIPNSIQLSGDDDEDRKEEIFKAFSSGQLETLITKKRIAAWGLNLQNCAHMTNFPSHSFEQYYQGVRRCWRFGQTRPVTVDTVTTEGQLDVISNLQRKARAADKMFADLIQHMNQAIAIDGSTNFSEEVRIPSWL